MGVICPKRYFLYFQYKTEGLQILKLNLKGKSRGYDAAPSQSVDLAWNVDRYENGAVVTFRLVEYHWTNNNIPAEILF